MRIVTSSITTISNGQKANHSSRTGAAASTSGGPKVPRGLRQLPITSLAGPTNTQSEYDALQADAASIEQWWSNPRWQHTKRVYSGKNKKRIWELQSFHFMFFKGVIGSNVISTSLFLTPFLYLLLAFLSFVSHGCCLSSSLPRSSCSFGW